MEIQEYLIATIQNIEVLLRYGGQPKKSLLVKANQAKGVIKGVIQSLSRMMKDFMVIEINGIMPLAFARVQFREP